MRLVSQVAAMLAERDADQVTHVLQVATYLPLDVQSVARIMESLEDNPDFGVHRVQKDVLNWVLFDDPERFIHSDISLDDERYLTDCDGLLRTINALKSDPDWERKMREEHQVLQVAAAAKHRTIELAYLTRRVDLSSAKLQSILNDFDAEGHIDLAYDEDTDTLSYTFPEFDYPAERFERNMSYQAEAEPAPQSRSLWAIIGLSIFGIILVLLLIQLAI